MRFLLPVALLIGLSACTLPQTTVRTGSSQPSLIVRGAPDGAVLFVDGLAMGPAPAFDGNPRALAVLEGAHQVEVRQGDTVLYREKVFLSSGETHPIMLLPGTSP